LGAPFFAIAQVDDAGELGGGLDFVLGLGEDLAQESFLLAEGAQHVDVVGF